MRTLVPALLFFLAGIQAAFGQCACMGGAAVGGLTPVGGTANVGVLRSGYLRATSFYRFSTGSTTLAGDTRVAQGPIASYESHYTGLLIGYGLDHSLTLEAEAGYYPRKAQDFSYYTASGHGFSHLLLGAKYNLYSNVAREWEFTIGASARVPLSSTTANLPQHVLPASGAFGGMATAFLHKGWKSAGARLLLIHKADYSAENTLHYRYGDGYFTSLIVAKSLLPRLAGFLELRHEYRRRDRLFGSILEETGSSVFVASPQVNIVFDEINISALFDYPFYRYYNGHQLANDYSVGLTISWQTDAFGE